MVKLTGGTLLERRLRALADKLGKGGHLNVGFLEGATYPDGTSVALVAAVQNFGSPAMGVPPRPFFTNMVEDKSPGWGDALAGILKAQNYDVDRSLALMGGHVKGQLQQSIVDTNAPPLSPETIARKGFAKPLIDSSNMINSVDYEVTPL